LFAFNCNLICAGRFPSWSLLSFHIFSTEIDVFSTINSLLNTIFDPPSNISVLATNTLFSSVTVTFIKYIVSSYLYFASSPVTSFKV